MKTFATEDASTATIILMGKIFEALREKGVLSDVEASSAINGAITQLRQTGESPAADVLEHYFQSWTKLS